MGGHEQDGGVVWGELRSAGRRRTTYADVFRMSKGKTCCSKMRGGGSRLHLLPADDVVTGDISPCNVSVGLLQSLTNYKPGPGFPFVVVSKRHSSGRFDVVFRRRKIGRAKKQKVL